MWWNCPGSASASSRVPKASTDQEHLKHQICQSWLPAPARTQLGFPFSPTTCSVWFGLSRSPLCSYFSNQTALKTQQGLEWRNYPYRFSFLSRFGPKYTYHSVLATSKLTFRCRLVFVSSFVPSTVPMAKCTTRTCWELSSVNQVFHRHTLPHFVTPLQFHPTFGVFSIIFADHSYGPVSKLVLCWDTTETIQTVCIRQWSSTAQFWDSNFRFILLISKWPNHI